MPLGYVRRCNIWSDVTGLSTQRHPIMLQSIWKIETEKYNNR